MAGLLPLRHSGSTDSQPLVHPCALPLYGINDHSLDAKNRLTVPAKSRADLTNAVTLTMAIGGYLELWPAAEYEAIARQALQGMNPMTPKAKQLKRHFYGNAVTMELDGAGRVMLPQAFADHAQIKKDVKVIGAGDYLELWDGDVYEQQNADLMGTAGELLESLGDPS